MPYTDKHSYALHRQTFEQLLTLTDIPIACTDRLSCSLHGRQSFNYLALLTASVTTMLLRYSDSEMGGREGQGDGGSDRG